MGFTVSIPIELKIEMDRRAEIDWPQYLRKQFEKKIARLGGRK